MATTYKSVRRQLAGIKVLIKQKIKEIKKCKDLESSLLLHIKLNKLKADLRMIIKESNKLIKKELDF